MSFVPVTLVAVVTGLLGATSAFHVTRNTEIGLCTFTDDKNRPHKFSCFDGDRNYCCGDRRNQTCCSVDQVRLVNRMHALGALTP